MIVPVLFFFFAGRKASAVPGKLQNLAETAIDFVEKQVILPAIGKEGMRYLPMLTAMVFFIWIGNLFEIIPTIADAGERPHGQPARPGDGVLGHVHRRRCEAQRPRLLQVRPLPARRAQGAVPAGHADRVPLDLPHPALLAGRATLRQHARRPHPARDLHGADHHVGRLPASSRSSVGSASPCWSPSPASSSWWRSCRRSSSPC
ncbi:MAG: F0F1 ATP synthase subunit A [Actinobacteria bacterium]|nr:F0F1 ATP synthase subunit A [Actinomycetota bacterium]